jgi:predicted extracellular nuclease
MSNVACDVVHIRLKEMKRQVPRTRAQFDDTGGTMKNSHLGMLAAALLFGPLSANAVTMDLFFSEYVEGSSFNKALEIYNGTGASIDLTGMYTVEFFYNGSTSAGLTIALSGTVADGDVFVLTNQSADAAILAVADQVTSATSWFNGDDAVVLRRGATLLDVIGQIGFDPGSEWGTGDTSTQDNTLRRMAGVCTGDANGSDPFDPALEWNGYSQNTFDGLGSHAANCGSGKVPEPGTLALLSLGLVGLGLARRRVR